MGYGIMEENSIEGVLTLKMIDKTIYAMKIQDYQEPSFTISPKAYINLIKELNKKMSNPALMFHTDSEKKGQTTYMGIPIHVDNSLGDDEYFVYDKIKPTTFKLIDTSIKEHKGPVVYNEETSKYVQIREVMSNYLCLCSKLCDTVEEAKITLEICHVGRWFFKDCEVIEEESEEAVEIIEVEPKMLGKEYLISEPVSSFEEYNCILNSFKSIKWGSPAGWKNHTV